MKNLQQLEATKRTIESRIRSLVGEQIPSLFDRRKWKGKAMEWVMKDDRVKVRLFRFIDALPSLQSDAAVVNLLNEYFEDVTDTPLMMKRGLGSISGSGIVPGIAGRIIRGRVASFARQFIAGAGPEDALPVLRHMWDRGLAFTVDLLGEAVLTDREAHAYVSRYMTLLDYLTAKMKNWQGNPVLDTDDGGAIPRLDISLKVSSFYSQIDPMDWEGSVRNTTSGLSGVLEKAARLNASLTVDMEHYHLKDLTIEIFKAALDEHKDFGFGGIALQAYLTEAKQDVLQLLKWAKSRSGRIAIRLVKGAYWDYETVINRQQGWPVPVFQSKEQTDATFDELTTILLEHTDTIRPAIATHNIRSISHAIATAELLKLPKDAFEFQVIFGMAEPVRSALLQMGYRVRVYTPVGELIPGMAYLIRRLLENTSNESFLRQTFYEASDESPPQASPSSHAGQEKRTQTAHAFHNEPTADFSKSENRHKMKDALDRVRRGFGTSLPLVIGGEEVRSEKTGVSINPARPDQVVGRFCEPEIEHVEHAIAEAGRASKSWSRTPPEQRALVLRRAGEGMRKQRFDLMALEVYEVGKSWKDADGDVCEAIDFLEYYASEMVKLGTPRILGDYPGERNQYLYEAKGVGAVISPWNFPLAIPAGMVSAGLVTGNCVILKPSSLSPVCGWKLFEIFRLAGLPPGVLQFVPGSGGRIGDYLTGHEGIDFIAFTGSQEVGLRIVELAGKTHGGQRSVKKVIAELGGKNAVIVDETADLDEAVKGILESALGFQGQKCSACSRVIVVGDVYDAFCRRVKEAMESISIGPAEDPGSYMGPVVDKEALDKIRRYIEIAREEGKPILVREAFGEGFYVGPVIVTDVNPRSRVAQEEIFGPVVAVMNAVDMDEALGIANCTAQALTGGIYSRSPANIRKAERDFMVGNLYINRRITGALVGRQPFGGFGMSGIGSKAGGPDYLLQFMNARSISENTLRRGFAAEV
ncbi:MAG: L-glutamate gamma-semialdehyde dehydrogenase [Desulfomonilaceae bacterium]|nr:L-glutamate gamma-semialdehyde dehydrogenase [Desulfomonilaceae bacterium]